jgi:hypothetical protein
MEFIKNELINGVLDKYFETFSKTLDTADYVPKKYLAKIHRYIFKNMRKKFRQVNRAYRKQKRSGGKADNACAALPPPAAAQSATSIT